VSLASIAHAAGESPERCAFLKSEIKKQLASQKQFQDAIDSMNCGAGNPSEGTIAECDRLAQTLAGINFRLQDVRSKLANSSCSGQTEI
jgi:hypothetical protein